MEEKVLTLSPTLTATLIAPPVMISFSSPKTGEHLGEFKEKDGELTFTGNVDEAGQVFVDFICKSFNARIQHLLANK